MRNQSSTYPPLMVRLRLVLSRPGGVAVDKLVHTELLVVGTGTAFSL